MNIGNEGNSEGQAIFKKNSLQRMVRVLQTVLVGCG